MKQTGQFDNGNKVYEFATMTMQYVTIDDNYPPYQLTDLDNPASYYTNPQWAGCKIESFIVPLYSKIYLEAGEARQAALLVLNLIQFSHQDDIVVKTFLASSRSFKNSLALNDLLDSTAKELLINLSMPKFVWVTEVTTKPLLEQRLVNGLVIADATEPKRLSIIACLAENSYVSLTHTNITQTTLSLPPFRMFDHNLKSH